MMKAYQYQFDLQISRVHLQIPFACSVELWWRKGNKKITTKNKIQLTGRQKIFEVGQKLSMLAVCQSQNNLFAQKTSIINIVIITPNNPQKSGGYYNLELTDVLKSYDPLIPITKNYEVPIQGCPTKNGKLFFILSAKYITQVSYGGNHSFYEQKSFQSQNLTKRFSNNQITFRADDASMEFSFQANSKRQIKQNEIQKKYSGGDYNQSNNIINHSSKTFENGPTYSTKETGYFQKQKTQNNISKSNETQSFYQLLDMKRKLDEKNNEYGKLQMDYSRLHKDNVDFTQKIRIFQNESKNKELKFMNQINKLSHQYERVKRDNLELTSKVYKMKEEHSKYESLPKKIEELQNQIFRKQSQIISVQTMMSNRLKQAVSNIQRLNQSNSSLNYELKISHEKIEVLQKQIMNAQSKVGKQKEIFETKLTELQSKIKQKETIIETARIKNDNLEQKLKQFESQKQYFSKNMDKIIEDAQKNQQYFGTKMKQIQTEFNQKQKNHDTQLKELNTKIKALEEVVQRQETQLQQKENVLQKAKDYVNFKQQQISKRDEFIAKAKQYISNKQNQFLQCLESLTIQKNEKQDILQKMKQKDMKLEQLINKIQYLEIKLKEIKQGDQKAKLNNNTLVDKYNIQINSLKSMLSNKEKYLQTYVIDLSSSMTKIDELQQEILQKNNQIEELKEYISEFENDQVMKDKQTKARMEQLLKQNAQYQIQLNIYKNEVKNFKEQIDKNTKLIKSYQQSEKAEQIIRSQKQNQLIGKQKLADTISQKLKPSLLELSNFQKQTRNFKFQIVNNKFK